jgi:hypothetical protein
MRQHLCSALVLLVSLATDARLATAQTTVGQPVAPGSVAMAPGSYLLVAATAHSLPAGTGYVQIADLALARFQVGLTDRVSVGGGTVTLHPRALMLTGKAEVYRGPHTSAAIGAVYVNAGSGLSGSLTYGVATKDAGNASFTAGIGMIHGHFEGKTEVSEGSIPAGVAGVEWRRSEHGTMLVEAYVFGPVNYVNIAWRHTWTRFSVDYGVTIAVGNEAVIPPAPIINMAWRF